MCDFVVFCFLKLFLFIIIILFTKAFWPLRTLVDMSFLLLLFFFFLLLLLLLLYLFLQQ